MIGVIANPSKSIVVEEFFELFKTAWEWYQTGRHYEVLLCAGTDDLPEADADLILVYAGHAVRSDINGGIEIVSREGQSRMLQYKENQIPIYGDCATFPGGANLLVDQETQVPAIRLGRSRGRSVARMGYDLLGEVQKLLTVGQPATNAGIPALELHIDLLRDLIVMSGAPLAEIPPVPEGYRFIACLTHDIDHPSVRRHKFDHTTLGFLYRALLGSLRRVCRRQLALSGLLRNWTAAAKLPFVHLGLAKDFWYDFDRYVHLEEGLPSTFFAIPFRDYPGRLEHGSAPGFRASRYGAADISEKIRALMAEGREIGVHGIDAWLDSASGRKELEEISRITGMKPIGARMHWLCFNEQSPVVLEQAGADYDSTVGYNETVGYRAGTGQAYRPMGTDRLLELPLHIMDTALFFPSCLNLSPEAAQRQVSRIINNAAQFGGVVTVNWHDRSIAPERCWDAFYLDMVGQLKSKGAWFASAADTVTWFRQRRAVAFERESGKPQSPHVKAVAGTGERMPGLQVRVYNACQAQPAA